MLLKRLQASLKRNGLRGLIRNLDDKCGLGKVEYLLATNWFNPFATLWLNLRSFPLAQAVRMPVWVYGHPRFYSLSGSMRVEGKVSSGMVRFNMVRSGSPCLQTTSCELQNLGEIVFRGGGIVGTGVRIFTNRNAKLDLGDKFKLTDMVNVGCMRSIKIGDGSQITQKCQIMDSNYHFIVNTLRMESMDRTQPIEIGKCCWIGNSSTITGGARIPDNTIVGSHSLVNHSTNNVPSESIIGGVPAKLIRTGYRRIYNLDIHSMVSRHFNEGNTDPYKMPENITPDDCSILND